MEDEFTGTKASEGRFLDCHVITSPVDTIVSGLECLEGEIVSIVVEGSVFPDDTVIDGQITVNVPDDSEVVIGMGYTSEVRPYLPEVPLQDGSSLGRMARITDVDIDFYNTLGGYIGKIDPYDGETIEELMFRRPIDEKGKEVPLFTGIYHYPFLEGSDRETTYFIRQVQPLPMTVRGVVDVVEVQS